VYRCDKPNLMMGLPRCMTFGGPRVDAAIGRELLLAVEPMAIDAAFEAECPSGNMLNHVNRL
jgi:hypothetical protein